MTRVDPLFENPVFGAAMSEIEALGFSVSERPTPGSVAYAIIGGRSNARWWLVPLTNRHVAVSGLAMFQPVVRSARIFKNIAVAAGFAGLAAAWTRKRIYISESSCFVDVFGEKDLHYAFFTGTDSPHRKVAVQIMGRDGNIKGFAKVSCNPLVKPLLVHEAETLNYVSTLNLQTALIPKVLFSGEIGGAAVLVTDTLKTGKSKTATTLTDAHLAFLRELSEKTAVSGTAGTDWVVSELRRQYDAVVDRLPEEWQKRFCVAISCLESSKVGWGARSLSHGDFTPWNTFFVDEKLYVFDWEYASSKYPEGYDLIHFIHSLPEVKFMAFNDSTRLVRKVLKEAAVVKNDNAANVLVLCYLFGQTLHYILREFNTINNVVTWVGEKEASAMIDSFLGQYKLC